MFLIHNERTKLTAAWLNTLATAIVAAGVFAPASALLYGLSELRIGLSFVVALTLGCLVFGLTLHVGGLVLLRRLRE